MSEFAFVLPPATEPVVNPAEPTVPNGRIDHVAAGLSRLYMQFRKPRIIELLTVYLERYNQLEQVAQDLLTKRTVFAAVDAQEDDIGKIVVQSRNGLDNDTYRRYLFAKIATNNSNGVVEVLIKIVKLILNDPASKVIITQLDVATTLVRISVITVTDALALVVIDLLRQAPLSGVRLRLEYSTVAPSILFTYDGPATYGTAAYGGSLE